MKPINASFRCINWNQRQTMLELKTRIKACDDALFTRYHGSKARLCFLKSNAQETDLLRGTINL